MANRRDFYFRQKVTEAELDAAFAEMENADRAITSDLGLIGVAVGLAVSQQVSPNLTVLVSGPGVVYDQTGQRVAIPSSQTVNCAVDEDALNTAVVTPGNSRILSLFIEFDRTLSDPRVDGNSATVYFVRAESFQFNVAAGVEGVSPTAPVLRADQILLADITLAYGATQILNGNISTTRREWMFKTTSGTAVACGTPEEAIQALATAIGTDVSALAAHLADAVDAHDASAISFSPTGFVAATDVQSAIAELDSEKLALAGGTMTGDLNMGGNDITNALTISATGTITAADFSVGAPSVTKAVPLTAWVTQGSGWQPDQTNYGEWETDGAIWNQPVLFDLLPHLPDGATFQQLVVVWQQTGGFAATADQASANLYRHQITSGGTRTVTDVMGFSTAYGAGTGIKTTTLNPANFTIDKVTTSNRDSALMLRIESAVGGVTRVLAIFVTYTDPGPTTV